MKKYILLFSLLLSTSIAMAAAKGEVKFKLIDDESGESMVGALVTLTDSDDETLYKTVGMDGTCSFSDLKSGEYVLSASFIGYSDLNAKVTVGDASLDLGSVGMSIKATKIDQVSVMATAIRTTQSGDTVVYNADAFKVAQDAAAEGLLAKMPGIKVNDGEVEAQGEEVKKVYLDGKEFFGEDVALAVKNIPADIIDKIEVFNKLSDEAEFTGFDDGDGYKAINIVTKNGMNKGHFGKFTAGYAFDDLYQYTGNYNYFTGSQRFSIVSMANNMNLKGFGSMDLVGGGSGGRSMSGGGGSFVGASSGISTLGGIGFNYGGEFLESKLKLTASYFYNTSSNESNQTVDREYVIDENDAVRYYDAVNESSTSNYNHRFNSMIEYKPNARHMFMLRPEFAYQDNGSNTYSLVSNTQSVDGLNFTLLNDTQNSLDNARDAFNISNVLVYRTLIGNKGRNIMFSSRVNYSQNDSDALNHNLITYAAQTDKLTRQNILNETTSYGINGRLTYSEPILDSRAMLSMGYNVNYNYSDADYLVYEWEQQQNMFNPDYDPTASNIYNSGYLTQKVGPGFMYSVKNSLQLNASVEYQYSTLANDQIMPVTATGQQDFSFNNIVYAMMMRKTFTPTKTLRVRLRSNSQNPSVSNLQEVVKDSNPQSVSSGNSDLVPSYNNSLRATYVSSDTYNGRTFMASVGGDLVKNYIGQSTIMLLSPDDTYILPNGNALDQFGQYTTPVNLDGKWSVTSSVSYGTPFYPIRSNLNFDLGVNYSEAPTIFNSVENLSRTTTYKAGLSIGSNISQNVDFTLSYNGNYNTANYKYLTANMSSTNNDYLTHSASANFKFVFWGGITLSGNTTYTQYTGITNDFNEEYVLCNVYVGKKLFKNQRGEITFGVNDLFNQSESFVRNITESYVENVLSNTIGRYWGLKFSFDLRSFSGAAPSFDQGRGSRGGRGGMPMM